MPIGLDQVLPKDLVDQKLERSGSQSSISDRKESPVKKESPRKPSPKKSPSKTPNKSVQKSAFKPAEGKASVRKSP